MIKPPIVVDSRSGLLVFRSRSEAETHLAPDRVRSGEYGAVYDREGRLLRLQVRSEEHRVLGLVRRVIQRTELVETEHIPTHETALRALLLRFIAPTSNAPPSVGAPLEGLIRSAVWR